MKNYVKAGFTFFISLVLVLTLSQSMMFAAASTTSFSDVPSNHWARTTIEWGIQQGITQGDGNNRFRPNDTVNQAEFMALLVRAFPNDYEVYQGAKTWYEPYYALAKQLGWQYVDNAPSQVTFNRGAAAVIIYNALEQKKATVQVAVNHLLTQGLATGKTSNTYEGFKSSDTLTRAEALTFVYRIHNYVNDKRDGSITNGQPVKGEKPTDTSIASMTLESIKLDSTVKELEAALGKPSRVQKTLYNYSWYVYNVDGKHLRYAVLNNKVVGFYSNSLNVFSGGKYKIGYNTRAGVLGNSQSDYYSTSENGYRMELYFDTHAANQVLDSILVMKIDGIAYASKTDQAAVNKDMELGVLDITNAYRIKHGLSALEWSDQAQKSSYLHSKDMSDKDYFNHTSKDGRSPFDRMKAQGITYRAAGENIAWGYSDDIDVMHGWINSKGHRDNILYEDYTHLGVGIYSTYYTQNFYAPQNW